jgi:LysM repeat protein
MNIKRLLPVLIILLMAVGLTSCRQAASKGPSGLVETQGAFPSPAAATNTPGSLINFDAAATATALAQQTPQVVQPTPTSPPPPAVTNTPPPQPAAPTAQPPVVPPPTPGLPATYTLQAEEFPYCIARRFNLNPDDLLRLNGLSKNSVFYPGLTLKIPQTGGTWPGERAWHKHPADYTVQANDTIYGIACYYGDVDPMVIALINGLSAPYTLKAGQVLHIP